MQTTTHDSPALVSHVITPASLGGRLGAALDPALAETASRLYGWEYDQANTRSTFPVVGLCQPPPNTPRTPDVATLRENEYVACRRDEGTYLFLADGYVLFPRHGTETRIGRYATNGAAPPPLPINALETALFRALLIQKALTLHALVFNHQGIGVMVLGESGAGKTTLALAALSAGATIVSDDNVALRKEGQSICAYSMRPFLQIRRNTLQKMKTEALPMSLAATDPIHQTTILEKTSIPDAFIDRTVISNILILPPAGSSRAEQSTVTAASRADGLTAAIGASLPHLFALNTEQLGLDPGALLMSLLATDGCFHLNTGSNLMDNPGEEIAHIVRSLRNL